MAKGFLEAETEDTYEQYVFLVETNERKREDKTDEAKAAEKLLKEISEITTCDCIKDSYYRGLYNGMEVMTACFENRETEYIDATKPKNNQV